MDNIKLECGQNHMMRTQWCHNCDTCGHMVLCQHSPSSSAVLAHILVLWVQEANQAIEDRTLYQALFYVSRRVLDPDSW